MNQTAAADRGTEEHVRRHAMALSLAVGVIMLVAKTAAYFMTGSSAILSDAAESVIHVLAVGFAAFSLWLGGRPARESSPYGYERISFFSAGFEGGAIIAAGLWIVAVVAGKWRAGLVLGELSQGTLITLGAAVVNLGLGWYLLSTGRKTRSLILEANGRHVLTDSWTSFGVVAGLLLVMISGWKPFDPLVAIAVAGNIVWSGAGLVQKAVRGLMDLPELDRASSIHEAAGRVCAEMGLRFHRLRFRDTGQHVIVSLHLLFPYDQKIGEAHKAATRFEQRLAAEVDFELEVFTHLEAAEDHCDLHPDEPPRWPG